MTNPTVITEAQAQELANKWNVFIAVDENGDTLWYAKEPSKEKNEWYPFYGKFGSLPIRISSTRPWTEQIWRPETNQQPRSNEQ